MSKRVFFSFHYQDILDFRANVVRNHWLTKKDRTAAGFFDASIWETAKRTSPLAVKRLINKSVNNTSNTCVLIGTDTYKRRWVRYEIFHSIYAGNHLFGVHINKIKNKYQQTHNYGPNPFDYLGLEFSDDGYYATPIEYKVSNWGYSNDYSKYKLSERANQNRWGKSIKLTEWYSTYKWVKDDGYNNFNKWVK